MTKTLSVTGFGTGTVSDTLYRETSKKKRAKKKNRLFITRFFLRLLGEGNFSLFESSSHSVSPLSSGDIKESFKMLF